MKVAFSLSGLKSMFYQRRVGSLHAFVPYPVVPYVALANHATISPHLGQFLPWIPAPVLVRITV